MGQKQVPIAIAIAITTILLLVIGFSGAVFLLTWLDTWNAADPSSVIFTANKAFTLWVSGLIIIGSFVVAYRFRP